MQRQSWQLILMVGLSGVLLGGCAGFSKWKGSDSSADSVAANKTPSDSDPLASVSKSKDEAKVKKVKKSDQAKNKAFEGQFSLARLCEKRGETEQAEQLYLELLKKEPKDARIHHRLGVMALQQGNFDKAEESFQTAKSLAPPTAELLSDMGYGYYLQQKMPEAEKALKEALKIKFSHETAINNLALVYGREGRYNEAKDLFLRVNSEAEAYANLGYVMTQNGETAKAKEMYLHALALDNKMKNAAKALLQIEESEQSRAQLASANSVRRPAPSKSTEEKDISDPSRKEKLIPDVEEESSQIIKTSFIVEERTS